jgi:hypothetical protein
MDPRHRKMGRRHTTTDYIFLVGSVIGSLIGATVVGGRELLRILVSPVRKLVNRPKIPAESKDKNHVGR